MSYPFPVNGSEAWRWFDAMTFGSGIARTLVRDALASGGGDAALQLDYPAMVRRYEFTEAELRMAVGHLVALDFARIARDYEGLPGEWLFVLTPGRIAEDARQRQEEEQRAAAREAKVALRGGQLNRRPIPAEVRAFVFDRDGHRCQQCGATQDLELDHVHPWSLGGPDTPDNLQVLCRTCNGRKRDSVALPSN
ncbi:HNH endonuclease [Streptomyces spiralis]